MWPPAIRPGLCDSRYISTEPTAGTVVSLRVLRWLLLMLLVGVGSLVVARGMVSLGWVPRLQLDAWWAWPTEELGNGPTTDGEGPQLALVVVMSPSCAWCRDESLSAAVRVVRHELAEVATEQGWSFVVIGVAQTHDPDEGVKFLRRFGRFHEISSGRGWMNSLLIRYVHQDFRGSAATPQLIVLRRELKVNPGRGVEVERVVRRVVGAAAIAAWAGAGAPIGNVGTGGGS